MNILKDYNNIKTPEELLNFMQNNITYGYLSKSGKIYNYNDKCFDKVWFDEYILQIEKGILKTSVGTCWDQVELERNWFLNNGYEVKTFFIMLNVDYENKYPTHSYLVYKDKFSSNWNLFENADYNNRGIYEFNSLEELINFQKNVQIKVYIDLGVSDEELKNVVVKEYKIPNKNLSVKEYLCWVLND